jgi:rhodanese-related sulfurtransferase
MITVTARWTDWEFAERKPNNRTVHPTPGRDPIVVECSSPHTAAIVAGVFERIGCTVTKEKTT